MEMAEASRGRGEILGYQGDISELHVKTSSLPPHLALFVQGIISTVSARIASESVDLVALKAWLLRRGASQALVVSLS